MALSSEVFSTEESLTLLRKKERTSPNPSNGEGLNQPVFLCALQGMAKASGPQDFKIQPKTELRPRM